jgi:chorismate mutase
MHTLRSFLKLQNGYIVISGPCSAEHPEQLFATVEELAKSERVHLLRAGIWKPRTRPGSFEGIGDRALPWLAEAKARTGLPVMTEVAMARHVEAALKHGVDVLWLGARTVANPFSVQEIADSLKGVDVPVLVKNPINPDLGLWIGAIERIKAAGIKTVAAVHRGFSVQGAKVFRNQPMWEIAIGLRTAMPELELICDPSHIAGKRDLVGTVAQYALDLSYDGLMIETHHNPDSALSDAAQQLTPGAFLAILPELKKRASDSPEKEYADAINNLRNSIDRTDLQIIQLLAERMQLIEELGNHKKRNNISVFQQKRWEEIKETRAKWAEELGINPETVTKIFEQIHVESLNIQNKVFSQTPEPKSD